MEQRTFKGTARSQLGPIAAFVLIVAAFVGRVGLDSYSHLTAIGYPALAFAFSVIVLAAVKVLAPPTLEIDQHGMTWKSWRYSFSCPWSDIDQFSIGHRVIGGRPKVAFNFVPGRIPSQVNATKMNRSVNGYDRSMANVWKISTPELVDLLNAYVKRSRGSSPAS